MECASSQGWKFDETSARTALHWGLAATSGAETIQHVDGGGCGTVVRVMSGRKLWIIGTPKNGDNFTNSAAAFSKRGDDGGWDSIVPEDMDFEANFLCAGDTLLVSLLSILFPVRLSDFDLL